MIEKPGAFCISLDFELIWGVFDVITLGDKLDYFKNTRAVIPKILNLFEKYGVHATWATVGMLFNESWEEWESNIPTDQPTYSRPELSSYRFGKGVIKNNSLDYLFFAPDLIRAIKEAPGQEIGSHTYSHYYCAEGGADVKSFSADLKVAKRLAGKFNIPLKSLVFPRNQIFPEYLKSCYEEGFTSVRSNPDNWFWKDPSKENLLIKLFRTGEAYVPTPGSNAYSYTELKFEEKSPLKQKASRFLRPFEPNNILHKLKIRKILSEMAVAAKQGKIYHLWWHPHNFGHSTFENLNDLSVILEHFKYLQGKYNFRSLAMSEIYEQQLLNKA